MEFAAACVDNQEPLRGEDLGIEISERLRESPAGTICADERLRSIRGAKQFRCALRQRRNRIIEHHVAGRDCSFRRVVVCQLRQLAARGDSVTRSEFAGMDQGPKLIAQLNVKRYVAFGL